MRASRFLKDLFTTGFSQVTIILFNILLLKLLTDTYSKDHFGIFNIVRRWDMVLIPLFTLNLSIGLTRFVSYQKEKSSFFLHLALVVAALLCIVLFPILLLFPSYFSTLIFKSPQYSNFLLMLAIFLVANLLHLLAYSYFRGKLDMNSANIMRTIFFGFPLLTSWIILLIKGKEQQFATVGYLHAFFLVYSIFGIFLTLFFLRKDLSMGTFKEIIKDRFAAIRRTIVQKEGIFTFSLSRVPGVFFSAMVFGFPVFFASYYISLQAAAYIGIVVTVLRLFEVFSMPFNMIFLPKFSSLKRDNDSGHIQEYCEVVLNFIYTFLPFCGVLAFGLIPFVVTIWFGADYLVAASSVALAVLFSVFYLAFALVRGILDGLFPFPYTNIISFSGFAVIATFSYLLGKDIYSIAIAFGCGLVALGIVAVGLVAYKLEIPIQWLVMIKAVISASAVFVGLYYADLQLMKQGWHGTTFFIIALSYRLILTAVLWWFYWRKTLWYKEVIKRLHLGAKNIEPEISN